MGASTDWKNKMLLAFFNNTAITGVTQGAASAGSLYCALHTGDPTAGTQSTNEVSYTGYARVAVARTSGGWTVATNNASNTAEVQWPQCTAQPGSTLTATYWSIGTGASGSTQLMYSGLIDNSGVIININTEPTADANDLDTNAV